VGDCDPSRRLEHVLDRHAGGVPAVACTVGVLGRPDPCAVTQQVQAGRRVRPFVVCVCRRVRPAAVCYPPAPCRGSTAGAAAPRSAVGLCGPTGRADQRGSGQLRDRQRGVRQLPRRIERHAQHAQQLFDELITGRVIDEFGIRQRHLQRGQHRTGDGGSGQPRLGLEEPARRHALPDVAQQARRHPALELHVVRPLPDERRGNLRATPTQP